MSFRLGFDGPVPQELAQLLTGLEQHLNSAHPWAGFRVQEGNSPAPSCPPSDADCGNATGTHEHPSTPPPPHCTPGVANCGEATGTHEHPSIADVVFIVVAALALGFALGRSTRTRVS